MAQTVPLINDDVEIGGKIYDEDGIENDFAYRNNVAQANKSIRMAFIRKVYGLLTTQILITVLITSVCMFSPPIKSFLHTNSWMTFIAFFLSMAVLIALHIKRRESPANLILLAIFTVVQAYTIGIIVTYYSQAVVLQALILTLIVLVGLTSYAFQSKHDFSAMYSGLFAGLCILIIGGLMQVFIQSTVFEIFLSFGGALLFCLFIIVDTKLIMETLSPEEYIIATITLYLDIINLFLYILRILQAMQNN